MTNELTSFLH